MAGLLERASGVVHMPQSERGKTGLIWFLLLGSFVAASWAAIKAPDAVAPEPLPPTPSDSFDPTPGAYPVEITGAAVGGVGDGSLETPEAGGGGGANTMNYDGHTWSCVRIGDLPEGRQNFFRGVEAAGDPTKWENGPYGLLTDSDGNGVINLGELTVGGNWGLFNLVFPNQFACVTID